MAYQNQKNKSLMEDCNMKTKEETQGKPKKQVIKKTKKALKLVVFGKKRENTESFQTKRLYFVLVGVFFLYLFFSFFLS